MDNNAINPELLILADCACVGVETRKLQRRNQDAVAIRSKAVPFQERSRIGEDLVRICGQGALVKFLGQSEGLSVAQQQLQNPERFDMTSGNYANVALAARCPASARARKRADRSTDLREYKLTVIAPVAD
jgi:hypothetical protein